MSAAISFLSVRTRTSRRSRRASPPCRRPSTSPSRLAPASRAAISPTTSPASRAIARYPPAQPVEAQPRAPRQRRRPAGLSPARGVEIDAALREDEADIGHDGEGEEGAHDDVADVMRGDDDPAGRHQHGEDRGNGATARPDAAQREGDGDGVGGMAGRKGPEIRPRPPPAEIIVAIAEQQLRARPSSHAYDEIDGKHRYGD